MVDSVRHMTEHVGIRFEIGDLFPANDPLARWLTPCAMALNDLLYVNRRLVPLLQNDGPNFESTYLSRLAAGHLYEISKFIQRSEGRVPEIRSFVAALDKDARDAYKVVKAAGPRGAMPFSEQLAHARNHVFHYAELVPNADDYETLKRAMTAHAGEPGEIRDGGTLLNDFRALFADEVATELAFPGDMDFREFVTTLSTTISAYLTFSVAAITRYISDAPVEHWTYIESEDGAA